jgi:ubiquinone biosynthesis protein
VTVTTVLTLTVGVIFNIAVLAYGARRLLGEQRFSLSRTVVAGLAGQTAGNAIINALAAGVPTTLGSKGSPPYGVVIGFVALGWACALLIAMAILVVWQAFVPAGTVPSPSSWPRRLRARAARSARYWQIVRIFTRCGLGPLLRGGGTGGGTSGGAGGPGTGGRSASLARSLSRALDRSGVVFVQFGQALSTRRDLLPPEFIAELGHLQDRVSPVPWTQIEQVLQAELDGTGAFARIDREPLAAASIAQVHAATLRTGERVVVKVLRPGVTSLVERDLDIIGRLARRLQARAPWARSLGVVTLADGFAAALREELDFRVEARNLAAVIAAAGPPGQHSQPGQDGHDEQGDIVIPAAYHDLSTRRVLVMQRLDGVAVSQAGPALADGSIDRQQLARSLFDTVLRQIVIDGVFHADRIRATSCC